MNRPTFHPQRQIPDRLRTTTLNRRIEPHTLKPYPLPKPKPSEWREDMTVAIAAITDEKYLVTVNDLKISSSFTSADLLAIKLARLGPTELRCLPEATSLPVNQF